MFVLFVCVDDVTWSFCGVVTEDFFTVDSSGLELSQIELLCG